MSFLKSAINQVGRDLGKVVSNHLFNGNNTTSYRISYQEQYSNRMSRSYKSDFDKAIHFQMGHRPSTLIAKICGVYTILKNESNKYISDGYLDTRESDQLFKMMNQFNKKVDDICDILEIDEINNEKEINQLITVVGKTKKLFQKTLQISAEGCLHKYEEHKIEAGEMKGIDFLNYIGLHVIWMGNYARGKEKSIIKTIIANLLDVFTATFPFTRSFLFFKSIYTFSIDNSKIKKKKNTLIQLAELEKNRSKVYIEIKNSISNEIMDSAHY